MTDYELCAEDIIADFLRTYTIDPQARAEASDSDNVTATAGQTVITLVPTFGSVSCVTSVTINGTESLKWKDYYWDYQNQSLTFYSAFSLSDAVVINYKYGSSNWIYSDQPDDTLSAVSFPRISIFTVSAPGKRIGQYNAPVQTSPVFQIDIWCKDRQIFTIADRKYSNEYLARYLGNKITKAFEENESRLFPVLYGFRLVSAPRTAAYSDVYQAFHNIVEVGFSGLRLGRIEK